jgi:hypothetical protein
MEEPRVCAGNNPVMRSVHIALAGVLLFFLATNAFPSTKEDFPIKKQPELQQIKPKKPVKIKLKRTAKDEYSWELSGDEVDEIVRTDQRLRKMLNVK